MSEFPTFDISRFQKIFSTVTGISAPLHENFFPGNQAYDSNRFQGQNFHRPGLQKQYDYRNRRLPEIRNHKINRNKERRKGIVREWNKNGSLKDSRNNDVSYQLFGKLPKFDPRFPFDRAYKLMENLKPLQIMQFPSINHFN